MTTKEQKSLDCTSARRLLELLELARRAGDGDRLEQIWARLFGLTEPWTRADIHRAVASVCDLVSDVEASIRAADGIKHTLYLRWVPHVKRITDHENLHTQLANLKSYLSDDNLTTLEVCADYLSNLAGAERRIGDEVLADLLASVAVHIDAVRTSIDDLTLREDLLSRLVAIERSIRQYHITGATSVHRRTVEAAGTLLLGIARLGSDAARNAARGVWGLLTRIDCSVTMGPPLLPDGMVMTLGLKPKASERAE